MNANGIRKVRLHLEATFNRRWFQITARANWLEIDLFSIAFGFRCLRRFHFRMDVASVRAPIAQSHNSDASKVNMKMDRETKKCSSKFSIRFRSTFERRIHFLALDGAVEDDRRQWYRIDVPILRIVAITIRGEHTTHGAPAAKWKDEKGKTNSDRTSAFKIARLQLECDTIFFFVFVFSSSSSPPQILEKKVWKRSAWTRFCCSCWLLQLFFVLTHGCAPNGMRLLMWVCL